MRLALILGIVVAAFVAASHPTAGGEFVVAPQGSDTDPGTRQQPMATVQCALEATRRTPESDRIVILPGTYYLTRSLELSPQDSGLTIEGEGTGIVLSGGRRVGGWKSWKGRTLQADLGGLDLPDLEFRQLYYNAGLQPWARVPNFDPQRPRTGGFLQNAAIVEAETKTKFRYREADLQPQRWTHPERAWIMFHDALNYETQLCPVKAIDQENRVVEAQRGVYRLSVGNPFYLCGLLEELDAPGEWCVDPDTNTLHFWPPAGDPNGSDAVIVPALQSLVVVRGKAAEGKWVDRVRISGLNLRDSRGPAISISGAKQCVISRCDLRNAEVGVYLGDDTHACQVRGCDITQTQGDGVSILGRSTDHERVSDHVVDNCYIWDFGWGRIHNRCGGVYMHRCCRSKITHNHVHDSPRYGLAMDVGNDCEFAYNYCHHVNLVTTDSGIIEAATALDWGLTVEKQRERHRPHNWGNTVHHNLLHDSGGWQTSPDGDLVFPAFTWGVYLDLGCSGWRVHDNVCYNTVLGGFMLNGGTDNVVSNNIFADGKQHQIQWNPWRGYVMRDNRCEQNIFAYAGSPANLYALNRFEDDFVAFRNNLIHPRDGQVAIQGVQGLPRQGVWEAWQARGQDQRSLKADPRFADAAAHDYRLAPDSPAPSLGIKPIDLSQVGNYADPDRRTWPRPEMPVVRDPADYTPVVTRARQPALRDYEDSAVGERERHAHVGDGGAAGSVAVSDATAAAGKQSLKFTDAAGLAQVYAPFVTYPLEVDSGRWQAGFDVRLEAGAVFVYEWRDDPYQYNLGPRLSVDAEGRLSANGKPLAQLPHAEWVRIDLACGLGEQATGTYDLTLRLPGAEPEVFRQLPCAAKFKSLACVVVMSMAEKPTAFYLDRVKFRPADKSPQ
ncbi:MAG: right-handed parallel beta-helix repeat-containing protein [Rhodopirellula sp.]|nr:right-handed parallel beta-helix repeat-containing protein [Rhodopirellula sp.]